MKKGLHLSEFFEVYIRLTGSLVLGLVLEGTSLTQITV